MSKEIIIPDGWEIDLKESGNGKVVLREVEKPKAKTWEEVQDVNFKRCERQFFLTCEGRICEGTFEEIDIIGVYKINLPTRRAAEKIVALCQMYILADYYNREYADGWVADWNNKLQPKFLPEWWRGVCSDVVFSYSDVRPAFASTELMMDCYNNNKQIFETALKS